MNIYSSFLIYLVSGYLVGNVADNWISENASFTLTFGWVFISAIFLGMMTDSYQKMAVEDRNGLHILMFIVAVLYAPGVIFYLILVAALSHWHF